MYHFLIYVPNTAWSILTIESLLSRWNSNLFESPIFYLGSLALSVCIDPWLPQSFKIWLPSNLLRVHWHLFSFIFKNQNFPLDLPNVNSGSCNFSFLSSSCFNQRAGTTSGSWVWLNKHLSFPIHISNSLHLFRFSFTISLPSNPREVTLIRFCNRDCNSFSHHYFPSSDYSAWQPVEFNKYLLNELIKE